MAAAGTPASYIATAAGDASPKTPSGPFAKSSDAGTSEPGSTKNQRDDIMSPTSPAFRPEDFGDAPGDGTPGEAPGDMTPTTPAFLGKVHGEVSPVATLEETPAVLGDVTPAFRGQPEEDEEDEDDVPHTLSSGQSTQPAASVPSSDPVPTAEATPRPLKAGQETPLMPPGQETPLMPAGDETPTFRAHTPAYANAEVAPAMEGDVTPLASVSTVPTEAATSRPTRSEEEAGAEDAPAAKRRRKDEEPP